MGGCSDPKQQVTTMVLKVDLHCCQCYKKVKRLLCKFPQIRDQVYDQKQNTVTITVVCCSPEKIRDKLCCKGGKSIKSIEIKKPKKPEPKPDDKQPKPDDKQPKKPEPKPDDKQPKPDDKQPKKPCEPEAKWVPGYPPCWPPCQVFLVSACCDSCYHGLPGGPCYEGYGPRPPPVPKPKPPCKPAEEPDPPKKREPEAKCVPGYPPCRPPQAPVSACCDSCYHGLPGGPCYQGYGPRTAYAYSYGRPPCPPTYYGSRCDYFSEENPNSACSIM